MSYCCDTVLTITDTAPLQFMINLSFIWHQSKGVVGTWSIIRWILSPGPGERKRATMMSPAPLWKGERFSTQISHNEGGALEERKRHWAAACCYRCSILSGKQSKKMPQLRNKRYVDRGTKRRHVFCIMFCNKKKKKEKKNVILATCVVIQIHLWKADIGRPTYQSGSTVLSHSCPFINKVYF